MKTRRITNLAFFTAIALILSMVESFLPPLFFFAPGAKMGLSNAAALIALVVLGVSDAIIIQALRCLLGGLISGGLSGLMYSFPAGMAALLIMIILYKFVFPRVSLMGISFFGAVINNLVQVMVASLVTKTNLAPMLPYYILVSLAAGLFVGIVSFFVIKFLPKKIYLTQKN